MDIGVHNALGTRKTADADFFTDLCNSRVEKRIDGQRIIVHRGLPEQFFHACGILQRNLTRDGRDKGLEIIRLCNKVGLAVDFNNDANLAVFAHIASNKTFCSDTAGLFCRCGKALFTKKINGFFCIAITRGEGFLAVHHASAGALAQSHNIFCSKHPSFLLRLIQLLPQFLRRSSARPDVLRARRPPSLR